MGDDDNLTPTERYWLEDQKKLLEAQRELRALRLSADDLLSLAIAKQLIGEVLQERKPDVDATDAQRAAWRRIADCLPVLSRLLGATP